MGWFTKNDWNVIAIIFERKDLFSVNGNRAKGKDAEAVRDGAKKHPRTLYWAVFNQKGAFLEGGPGPSQNKIEPKTYERLKKDLMMISTVRDVLRMLETKATEKAAKPMIWAGYPLPEKHPE